MSPAGLQSISRVSTLEPPPATEREGDQALWDLPLARTLVEVLERPAAAFPQAEALRFCHHGRPLERLRWADLRHGAALAAQHLRRFGVEPGDRVMLVLPTVPAFVHVFFGTILLGAVPVTAATPSSLRGPEIEPHLELLANIANSSGAKVLVSTTRWLLVLRTPLAAACPSLTYRSIADLATPGELLGDPWSPAPDDTVFIQYTSGSTSQPKGVELSHRNILANADAVTRTITQPGDVGFSWLPLYHDMGLIGTLLMALYRRIVMVLMPPQAFIKDPARWLRGIHDHRATITVAPNFAFNYCLKAVDLEAVADLRLDRLRVALNGAEPIDARSLEAFERHFAHLGLRPGVAMPVYGLAESTLAVTFSRPGALVVDEVDAEILELHRRAEPARERTRCRRLISVGHPLPTQEVRIVDTEGRCLEDRRVGEIEVKGPSVMKAYFQDAEATAEAVRNGWLRTGDLGYLVGGSLFIAGRSKDIIIRHGRNYHPQDIEHRVSRLPGVRKGCVVAFGFDREEEPLVVVVAESRLTGEKERAELEQRIHRCVHHTCLFSPDEILLVPPETIPKTTSGKVRRKECQHLYRLGDLTRRRGGYGLVLRALAGSLLGMGERILRSRSRHESVRRGR